MSLLRFISIVDVRLIRSQFRPRWSDVHTHVNVTRNTNWHLGRRGRLSM